MRFSLDLCVAMSTTTLYRPLGNNELALIEASGWTSFPPRLPEQPIFYPVTNLAYARQITREWNVPAKGIGHVVRLEVDTAYLSRFPVQNVGGAIHDELWVPADELAAFNAHIQGPIELIETYRAEETK